jgi:acyl-CoA thioesterase-1
MAAAVLFASCDMFAGSDDDDDDEDPPANAQKVVCLGDSLTAGYYADNTDADVAARSYPAYLDALLDGVEAEAGVEFSVINAGVTGDTAAMGYARLDADVLANDPFAVIVCLGANDFLGASSLNTAITDIETNLRAIVDALNDDPEREVYVAKFYNETVARAMLDSMGLTDTANQTSVIASCDALYADLATDYGVTIIEDIWTGVWGDSTKMASADPDGIHPIAAGYEVMAQNIFNGLFTEE